MGKISNLILDNISTKEMNIGLLVEIKKQKEIIQKKDKLIADMLGGTSWTKQLVETVNIQEKTIKSGKRTIQYLLACVLIQTILVVSLCLK